MSSPSPAQPPVGGDDRAAEPPFDAALARRLAALAYELLLYAALVLVAGFLTLPLLPPAAPGAAGLRMLDLPARVLSFALVFGVGATYYVGCWTGGRRTLPMKTWHLRVVRANGAPLDLRTAALRYVAAWIGPVAALAVFVALRPAGLGAHAVWLVGLNYLWAFVDPHRRFLHDRIAGTRLVRDEGASQAPGRLSATETPRSD